MPPRARAWNNDQRVGEIKYAALIGGKRVTPLIKPLRHAVRGAFSPTQEMAFR